MFGGDFQSRMMMEIGATFDDAGFQQMAQQVGASARQVAQWASNLASVPGLFERIRNAGTAALAAVGEGVERGAGLFGKLLTAAQTVGRQLGSLFDGPSRQAAQSLNEIPLAAQKIAVQVDAAMQRAANATAAAVRANNQLAESYRRVQAANTPANQAAFTRAQDAALAAMARSSLADRAAQIAQADGAEKLARAGSGGSRPSFLTQAVQGAGFAALTGQAANLAEQVAQSLQTLITGVTGLVTGAVTRIATGAGTVLAAAVQGIQNTLATLGQSPVAGAFALFHTGWTLVTGAAQQFLGVATEVLSGFTGLVSSAIQSLGNLQTGIIGLAGGLSAILMPAALPFIAVFTAVGLAGSAAFTGILSSVSQVAGQIAGSLSQALQQVLSLAGQVGGALLNAFASLAEQGVTVNEAYQSAQLSFETLTHSATTAAALTRSLREEARHTTLQFLDLNQAAQQLLAFGFKADQVGGIQRILGDVAAARGSSGMQERYQRLVEDFGRIKSRGVLEGRELVQLQEQGVNVRKILKVPVGADFGQLKMDAETYLPKLLEGLQAQFGGLQAKLMGTGPGILSNIVDAWRELTADVTSDFYRHWEATLRQVLQLFEGSPAGQVFTQALRQAMTLAGQLIDELAGKIPGLLELFGKFVESGGWDNLLKTVGGFFEQVGSLAQSLFQWFQANWSTIWDGFTSGARSAFLVAAAIFGGLQGLVKYFQDALTDGRAWKAFGEGIKSVAMVVIDVMREMKTAIWNSMTRHPNPNWQEKAQYDAQDRMDARDREGKGGYYTNIKNHIRSIDFGTIGQNAMQSVQTALGPFSASGPGKAIFDGANQQVQSAQRFLNGVQGPAVPARAASPPPVGAGATKVPAGAPSPDEAQEAALRTLTQQQTVLQGQLGLYQQLTANAQAYADSVHYGGQSVATVESGLRTQAALQATLLQTQIAAANQIDRSTALGQQDWLKRAEAIAKTQGELGKLAEEYRKVHLAAAGANLGAATARSGTAGAGVDLARSRMDAFGGGPGGVVAAMQGQLAALGQQITAQRQLQALQRDHPQAWMESETAIRRATAEAVKLAETVRTMPLRTQAEQLTAQAGAWESAVTAARAYGETTGKQAEGVRRGVDALRGQLGALDALRHSQMQLLDTLPAYTTEWWNALKAVNETGRGIAGARDAMRDLVSDTERLAQAGNTAGKMLQFAEKLGLPQNALRQLAGNQERLQIQLLGAESRKLSLLRPGTPEWERQRQSILGVGEGILQSETARRGMGAVGGRGGAGLDPRTALSLFGLVQRALNPTPRRLEDALPGIPGAPTPVTATGYRGAHGAPAGAGAGVVVSGQAGDVHLTIQQGESEEAITAKIEAAVARANEGLVRKLVEGARRAGILK